MSRKQEIVINNLLTAIVIVLFAIAIGEGSLRDVLLIAAGVPAIIGMVARIM